MENAASSGMKKNRKGWNSKAEDNQFQSEIHNYNAGYKLTQSVSIALSSTTLGWFIYTSHKSCKKV